MSNEDLDAFGGAPAGDATFSFPDMSDVKVKSFHLPPGWYSAVCTEVLDTKSVSTNVDMFVFEFEVGDSVSGTITAKQNCVKSPGALPFLKKVFIALGIDTTRGKVEIKPSKFVGRRLEIKLADKEYDGNINSKIADMRKHPQGAVASGGSHPSTSPFPPGPEDDDIPF